MRIAVFTKYYWPEGGGAELATYLILKSIAKDYTIDVYTGSRVVGRAGCCRIYYWELLDNDYKPIIWAGITSSIIFLKRILKGYDAVYIPSNALLPLALIVKMLYPGIKVIIHLHDYQPLIYVSAIFPGGEPSLENELILEYYTNMSRLRALLVGIGHYMNIINTLSLYHADRIICVSRRQASIITRHLPAISNRIRVVYNPLPENLVYKGKNLSAKPSFLYMGSGRYGKGFYVFLEASMRLLKEGIKPVFYMTGTLADKQERIIERLNKMYGRIYHVLGWISYYDVMEIHRKTWALLFPSLWEEPLPYAVIESGLLGTIPIAARVGGVEEILGGTIAEEYMFDPGNVDELVDRVKKLLTHGVDEVVSMGERLSRDLSRRFRKERLIEEIRKIFSE